MAPEAAKLHRPKPLQRGDMPFVQHLDELRKRVLRALAGVLVCFLVTLYFSKDIFGFLTGPLLHEIPGNQDRALFFTGLSVPFLNDLRVALFAAVFLASPIIFYQIWRFVSPGLQRSEKGAALGLAAFSTLLFLAGVAFAYFVVFPVTFRFFLGFSSDTIRPILTIDDYLSFVSRSFLGFGLIFQLPLVVLVLTIAGLVNARKIASVWRYAVMIIAVVSAALTPPDVASMLFMMAPLLLLYGLSILLAAAVPKRKS